MQKISEWLKESIGSHSIAYAAAIQKDFETCTGKTDVLPTHSVAETRKALSSDPRGGIVRGADDVQCVYGYELAFFLAQRYGSDENRIYRQMQGRGFMFHACIDSLVAGGN